MDINQYIVAPNEKFNFEQYNTSENEKKITTILEIRLYLN